MSVKADRFSLEERMEFFSEEEREGHGWRAGTEGYERMREREVLEQVFRLPRNTGTDLSLLL